MEDEAMRQSHFIIQCLKQLPEVKFARPVVTKLADNVYQVDVDVVNEKNFPTASDRSVILKRYTPDVIEASVKGGTLVDPGTKTIEEQPARSGYVKAASLAGEKLEFRAKGNSTTTVRYTVTTTNPANTTLTLKLKSIAGNESITVKLK